MTAALGRWRATYTPGEWVVLSGPTSLVVLEPPSREWAALINTLWDQVVASSSITDLASLLATFKMDQLPTFGAFFWTADGMRSLVRGQISVIDLATGKVVADGNGIQTWSEVGLAGVEQVRVDLAHEGDVTLLELPLVVGAVRASSVVLDASEGVQVRSPQGQPTAADVGDDQSEASAEASSEPSTEPLPEVVASAGAEPTQAHRSLPRRPRLLRRVRKRPSCRQPRSQPWRTPRPSSCPRRSTSRPQTLSRILLSRMLLNPELLSRMSRWLRRAAEARGCCGSQSCRGRCCRTCSACRTPLRRIPSFLRAGDTRRALPQWARQPTRRDQLPGVRRRRRHPGTAAGRTSGPGCASGLQRDKRRGRSNGPHRPGAVQRSVKQPDTAADDGP